MSILVAAKTAPLRPVHAGETCHVCRRSHSRPELWWDRVALGGGVGIKGAYHQVPVCAPCRRAKFPEHFWGGFRRIEEYAPLRPLAACGNHDVDCGRCRGSGVDADRLTGVLLAILADEISSIRFEGAFSIRVFLRRKPYVGSQAFVTDDLLGGLLALYQSHFRYAAQSVINAEVERRMTPLRKESNS